MARSKIRALAILFFSGYLIASCFALKGKAEDVTTDNILSQTFTSGNNWTGQLSSNHGTGTIAGVDEGYVENTEAYSLVDDVDISANQFNNGFTSNLSAKVWFWNSNNQDVVMKQIITNSDGNVTTQTKTITGSCATFNGCSFQDTGNNTYSIGSNSQTDFDIKTRFEFNSTPAGSASYSGSHNAADLKQPVLTITYDDTVLDTETTDALDDVEEALEDLQGEVFEDMEEFFFEEEYFTFNEEPQFEMEMEMETFTFTEEFIEEFFMEMDEEFFMEDEDMAFEDGPMFEFTDTEMEEIYEETNELVETFLPMVSEEEEFSSEESFTEPDGPIFMESTETGETFEEEEMMEEEPMMTETFEEEEIIEEEVAEESTEMAEEEVIEEESTEMAEEEAVEEESTEMVEANDEETFEEETQEEESTSETATASSVQDEKLTKQKKIQQKKAIVKNLDKIMDKVDKDIKDIAKNLAIKNIIKIGAMTSEQASLDMYQNAIFYKPKDIYLDQLNIFDFRQIYPNTNLASYTQNDKIEIKARKLNELNIKKQKLLMELEMLKNAS